MKTSSLGLCALFAGSTIIGACSQTTGLSPLQYVANGNVVIRERNQQAYNVLYSFGSPPDGNWPTAALIDVNGTFYGTTSGGGEYAYGRYHQQGGTVFSVTVDGAEKVLHSFGKGTDGARPYAPLIDVKGVLYGTTELGGSYSSGYGEPGGTVFRIKTDGAEKVLHSFGSGADGAWPTAGLIDVKGTLYGTTLGGGAYGSGTIFSITSDGAEKILYSFGNEADGSSPSGLVGVNGTLYGVTGGGGSYNGGTVFSVTTGGVKKVLHSFGQGTDGIGPNGPLVEVDSTLYGTTYVGGTYASCGPFGNGCGTVFSITTDGTEKILHNFGNRGDGRYPQAGLTSENGTLYGTTYAGGAARKGSNGTAFSITTAGIEKVLHRFRGTDGAGPEAELIDVDDRLYGTTYAGGTSNGGVVFTLKP